MKGSGVWKGLAVLLILCLLAAGCRREARGSRDLYAGATLVWRWEPCLEQTNCM